MHSQIGALRRRLGFIHEFPFTDSIWADAARTRECVDRLVYFPDRWRVVVIPADGAPRHFILRGTLESVTRRANLIFAGQTRVLAIEPEPCTGGETFDLRLSLSTPEKSP